MNAYDHRCGDCQRCPECGRSAWCENDRILVIPCEHKGLCGDCNLDGCGDCRLEAEQEMHRTGAWSPEADPFYRPENRTQDDAYGERPPLTFPGSPGFRADKDSA